MYDGVIVQSEKKTRECDENCYICIRHAIVFNTNI